jgi:hypothetical protein
MPEDAVKLIEQLISENPDLRPSVFELLTSENLPQEETFKEM